MMSNYKISFPSDVNYSDKVKFEQFSKLAIPEMVAIEHAFENNGEISKSLKQKKESFAYRKLPVIPFVAPRTKKLKIINFTKKIDSEIFQLLNVFEQLNLEPDKIDIHIINRFVK